MERRELEEIERFFASLGQRSPLAYYGLAEDADTEAVDAAIKKRRTWAQGQQSNPKYRSEALFLIKANANLRKLLIDERSLYVEHFGGGNPALTELDEVMTSAFSQGWTNTAEATIRAAGRRLSIEEGLVDARMAAAAQRLNLVREVDEGLGAATGLDLYELLAVPMTAGARELEDAYRARYRWARSLKDKERASRVLAALDAAWRIVKDPARRAAYDAQRAELAEATEEVERSGRRLGELLGGGESEPGPRSSEELAERLRAAPRTGTAPDAPSFPPTGDAAPPPFRMAPLGDSGALPVPTLAPAPSPDLANFSGRTIGLATGPQMLRERAPRLVVPVKSPVVLTLPRGRAVRYPLLVKNGGQGKMPAKVVTDVPWIVAERDWIDPSAAEQELVLELRPDRLPGNRGVGTVTVVADHGERRTVQFEVERSSLVIPLLGLLGVVALGVGGWYGWSAWQAANAPPPAAVLRLTVDPPSSAVAIDGVAASGAGTFEVSPPQRGVPFRLRVEHAGFRAHEELVTVDDASFTRSVRLEVEPMTWRGRGAPVLLDQAALAPVTGAHAAIAGCFAAATGELTLMVRIDEAGRPRGLELAGPGLEVEAGRGCVERVLALQTFPAPTGGWGEGTVVLAVPAP